MYDIIAIGSATRDAFFKSGEFRKRESFESKTGKEMCLDLAAKIAIPEVIFTTGGGSTNAVVSFARQGFKTACIARVGDDVSGREIRRDLEKEGIVDLLQTDKEHKTAYSLILVTSDGERTILEFRGANDYLSEKEIPWPELKSGLPRPASPAGGRQAGWLYLDSLAGNEKLLAQAINWARESKMKIAYNPSGKEIALGKKLHHYLNEVDIFIVNESEAAGVVKIKYSQENENKIFEELDKIVKGIVVMSRGPGGVTVSDGKKRYSAGVPDAPVIDRTGAGDAFGSGFVSGYIQSQGNIEQAIQLGTANATSVVQYFGAKEGLLKKGDWGEYPKVEVKTTSAN